MAGSLISFLGASLLNKEAVPRVVSALTPLPVTLSATGNNLSLFRLASSAASNNAVNLLVGPGSIFSVTGRIASGSAYLKFYNTAGVPDPTTDIPEAVFPLINTIPVFQPPIPFQGLFFPLGIGMALVTGPADNNNTAVAAGQILGLQITFQQSL